MIEDIQKNSALPAYSFLNSASQFATQILGENIKPCLGVLYNRENNSTQIFIGLINSGNVLKYIDEDICDENEMFNSNDSETYSAKIGLMYASDYAYAASPENWNLTLYEYDSDTNINNNWMFMGANEWIMISCSNVSSNAFRITRTGYFDSSGVYSDNAIRPTFYLNSDVAYVSGTGTQTDPYRIS